MATTTTSALFDPKLLASFRAQLQQNQQQPMYFHNFDQIQRKLDVNTQLDLVHAIDVMCKGNLGNSYVEKGINICINEPDYADMLLILAQPLTVITTQKDFEHNILGVLIAEMGECRMMGDVFSVRLICSNCGKGSVAMACFLYCIAMRDDVDKKEAVLELAGGYTNVGGFCLYQKYGFQPNPDQMVAVNCFPDAMNLPMQCIFDDNFGKTSTEMAAKIIRIVNNLDHLPKLAFCSMPKEKQMVVAMCENLIRFIEFFRSKDLVVDYVIGERYKTLYRTCVMHAKQPYDPTSELLESKYVVSFLKAFETLDENLTKSIYHIMYQEPPTKPKPPCGKIDNTSTPPPPPPPAAQQQRYNLRKRPATTSSSSNVRQRGYGGRRGVLTRRKLQSP